MNIDETLERTTWDFFWVPPEVRVIDRPELLYLCSQQPTTTLNMVTRIRPQNAAHAAALIAEVAAAHAGRPSWFQLTARSGGSLLRPELESAGYALSHEHDAMGIAVADFTPRRSAAVAVRRVVDLAGLKDNIRVSAAAFGQPSLFTEADLVRQLRECTAEGCRVRRFVAYDPTTGAALAAGNLNVFPALGLGFFWGGGTLVEARGRGAYSALVGARVAHALSIGLGYVGLYARLGTSAPIVHKQRFVRHGSMEYWDSIHSGDRG